MALENLESFTPNIDETRAVIEEKQRSISEHAQSAWDEFTSDDGGVSAGIETIRESASDAWDTCGATAENAGQTISNGAHNGVYVGGRFVLGAASVGENAYVGVRSNAELLMGDRGAAVETAQTHVVDEAVDDWNNHMNVSDQVREIGDYAETGGEIAAELVLGTAATTAGAPVALGAGSALVADEMGRSLESGAADSELSNNDVAVEVTAGAATAGVLGVGRGLSILAKTKIAPENSAGSMMPDTGIVSDINTTKTGGRYGDLRKVSNELEEVHHMPAASVSPLERADGPAIRMSKEDHRLTASCGNSREARLYRQQQQDLIEQGKFREATQMDIDDLNDKFGNKYDEAVKQMLEDDMERGLF